MLTDKQTLELQLQHENNTIAFYDLVLQGIPEGTLGHERAANARQWSMERRSSLMAELRDYE